MPKLSSLQDDLHRVIGIRGRRFNTASAWVAACLREALLQGAIPGGTPLRQDDLAALFGVSRMPVREALKTLEADGLVTFHPHRGAVATILSVEEAVEIYELKEMAEPFALTLAFSSINTSDLQEAECVLRQMSNEETPVKWIAFNSLFHEILYAPAGRKKLLSFIKGLNESSDRYLRFSISQLSYQAESQSNHQKLLRCIKDGSASEASQMLRQHIVEGGAAVVNNLSKRAETESSPY